MLLLFVFYCPFIHWPAAKGNNLGSLLTPPPGLAPARRTAPPKDRYSLLGEQAPSAFIQ